MTVCQLCDHDLEKLDFIFILVVLEVISLVLEWSSIKPFLLIICRIEGVDGILSMLELNTTLLL